MDMQIRLQHRQQIKQDNQQFKIHKKLTPKYSIDELIRINNKVYQSQFLEPRNTYTYSHVQAELSTSPVDKHMNNIIKKNYRQEQTSCSFSKKFSKIFNKNKSTFDITDKPKSSKRTCLVQLNQQTDHLPLQSKYTQTDVLRAKKLAEQNKKKDMPVRDKRKMILKKKREVQEKFRSIKGKQVPFITYDFEGEILDVNKIDYQKMVPLNYQCHHRIMNQNQAKPQVVIKQKKLKTQFSHLLKSDNFNKFNSQVLQLQNIKVNSGVTIKYQNKLVSGPNKKTADTAFLSKNHSQNQLLKQHTIQMSDYMNFIKGGRLITTKQNQKQQQQQQQQKVYKNEDHFKGLKKRVSKRKEVFMRDYFKTLFQTPQANCEIQKEEVVQTKIQQREPQIKTSMYDHFNMSISNNKDWGNKHVCKKQINQFMMSFKQLKKISKSIKIN